MTHFCVMAHFFPFPFLELILLFITITICIFKSYYKNIKFMLTHGTFFVVINGIEKGKP